ncbi:MAG: Hsp70 family protein, partial [Prevotellaceae bacterium]|nr:Hsp70 family protein [Prevotellaceae bacterium]
MSRIKIDYGIDLGTTNSAIARMVKGNPIIIKSDTLKDTMPSCVSFNRRGDCLVGDSAMSVLKNDFIRSMRTFERGTTSTFIEFKRTMGKDTKYSCHNLQRELTSEELSAEVLKKLKSFVLDEKNILSIVITVPAKFSVPQNEATIRAAKMAGFEQVVLLQEPIAA